MQSNQLKFQKYSRGGNMNDLQGVAKWSDIGDPVQDLSAFRRAFRRIFKSANYACTSPFGSIESIESLMAWLGFGTVKINDTEEIGTVMLTINDFSKYTELQDRIAALKAVIYHCKPVCVKIILSLKEIM